MDYIAILIIGLIGGMPLASIFVSQGQPVIGFIIWAAVFGFAIWTVLAVARGDR